MSPFGQFLGTLEPAGLREFFGYWRGKRGGRTVPARRDVDPAEMRRFLPNIYMFDVVEPGPRFRFRLVGTAVASIIGDLTDQFIDGTLSPDVLPRYTAHMLDVTENFAAHYMAADLAWQNRPHIRFHRLLLPLSDDQRRANILLGIAYYIGAGERRKGDGPGDSPPAPGPAQSMTELADARIAASDIPPA